MQLLKHFKINKKKRLIFHADRRICFAHLDGKVKLWADVIKSFHGCFCWKGRIRHVEIDIRFPKKETIKITQ